MKLNEIEQEALLNSSKRVTIFILMLMALRSLKETMCIIQILSYDPQNKEINLDQILCKRFLVLFHKRAAT